MEKGLIKYNIFNNNNIQCITFWGITFGTSILGAGIVIYIYNKTIKHLEYKKFQEWTLKKQKKRTKELNDLENKYPLTSERIHIVEMAYNDLMSKLKTKQITAVHVLESYIAKALQVNTKYNCITDFNPNGFELANILDNESQIKKPLHGLPICIKDDTDIIGMDTTLGCAKNLNKPKSKSASIVQILIDLGAIPFCKTNVPQTLYSFTGHNPIFGQTLNTLNPLLSTGGSSSGTVCLISGGGVLVGTGSDIAGSVRIPAHFNGISTIKPTSGRLSSKGVSTNFLPGNVGLKGVPGIFAKTPQILTSIFKAMTEYEKSYDLHVVPVLWNNMLFESKSKLRIGYYTSLPFFPAMGDTEEVILNAKKLLEGNGHTLIPFNHSLHLWNQWIKLAIDLLHADGGYSFKKMMEGEEVSHSIKDIHNLLTMSLQTRQVLGWLNGILPGDEAAERKANYLSGFDTLSSYQLWNCLEQRRIYIEQLEEEMDALEMDLILCPVFPIPAPTVKDAGKWSSALGYTMYYNLVDFPAGVMPFGNESGKNISNNECGNNPVFKLAKQSIRESIGMPIGVQIVGRPFKEELVLRLMTELDELHIKQ